MIYLAWTPFEVHIICLVILYSNHAIMTPVKDSEKKGMGKKTKKQRKTYKNKAI